LSSLVIDGATEQDGVIADPPVPLTATPNAPPNWRIVVKVADAVRMSAGCTVPSAGSMSQRCHRI
jgi:hypothetical protein